jgi:hypothetical protein
MLPEIVATVVSELVYVNKPLLLDVGATRLKDTSPNVFAGTEKSVRTCIVGFTVRVVVIEPDKKLAVLI